jgi:hypothetical protein
MTRKHWRTFGYSLMIVRRPRYSCPPPRQLTYGGLGKVGRAGYRFAGFIARRWQR